MGCEVGAFLSRTWFWSWGKRNRPAYMDVKQATKSLSKMHRNQRPRKEAEGQVDLQNIR